MDILQQEINRKRQALSQDIGTSNNNGKKYFKRSEIEQKRLQRLKQQEQEEKLENSNKLQQTQDPNPSTHLSNNPPESSLPKSSKPDSSTQVTDSYNSLPKHELFRRLRLLKQPVTLFGEDDEARLERFRFVLKAGMFEVDDDMTEGQTNDFLRDIVELKRRQKSGIDRKRKGGDDGEDGDGRDEDDSGDSGSDNGEGRDKDLKRIKARFEDLCDEDKILVFFKKLLNEWNQELDEMSELERRTAKGKSMVATFQQCARYLTPLFKFCRKKVLPDDIRLALIFIVQCCNKRDYLAAMDQYIKLAIGNAPWPIGVTMVGIHERSAREKIHTNSVAHIMNDETTRKYLQSIKRLMTFAQRRYPTMPSKAVEFNSLANGSDLQSLLAEERFSGGAKREEEKLLLMPAQNDDTKQEEDKLFLMPAPKDE